MSIFRKIKDLYNKKFGIKIKVKGQNNEIIRPKKGTFKNSKIRIYGNDNKIIFGENVYVNNVCITVGFDESPVENCVIKIGKNTNFNSGDFLVAENGSSIEIGENCMVSFEVEFNCSDTHSIMDKDGNLINRGESIKIGNHVWISKESRIMKNTVVPDGCIVAQRSIITKKFETPNCVLAGNPARQVKEGVYWDKSRPNLHLK